MLHIFMTTISADLFTGFVFSYVFNNFHHFAEPKFCSFFTLYRLEQLNVIKIKHNI